MIWLASFPRSGNTFFRIILDEVYGIESSEYKIGSKKALKLKNPQYYISYPVVKTHLLPHQLIPDSPDLPAVYLVRDGRDALVSMAHHRKDIVEPGSNYIENLRAAILALHGSHFGGWSQHVQQWLGRASIVIKFEDLIVNPIQQVERLRAIIDLPRPEIDNLPTFEDLRTKMFRYGSGSQKRSAEQQAIKRQKFFRRGAVGSWQDEMPGELHKLFWKLHGHAMMQLGYPSENVDSTFQCTRFEFYRHCMKAYKEYARKLYAKIFVTMT